MSGKNVNFGDRKTKKVIKIDDIDVNKTLVSKEETYCSKNYFRCFIEYNDDVIKPLCIKLPQMIRYVQNLDGNRTISFKISYGKLLKKYNQLWKRVEKLLKLKFDSEPVYGDNGKYIKTKIKIYGSSVITNFRGKGVPKEKALCKCLSIIMLDSVVNAKKKHPQTLLEECKHEPKKTKMENLSDEDTEKKFIWWVG